MGSAARRIESETFMPERTLIEERVDNLKPTVADLKGEITHLRAEVDRVDHKVDAVNTSLSEHRLETKDAFAKLREETRGAIAELRDETRASIAKLQNELTAASGAIRLEMKEYFDKHRNDRTAIILWMIGTMIAVATFALGAAKFFLLP